MKTYPLIDLTDLYHPHQDPGDNFDILTPYSLSDVDLKAVILDVTQRFREAIADHENPHYRDPYGPREPGVISMTQLNYLYGRTVPFAMGPFDLMRSVSDPLDWLPRGQQQGIELMLQTLREAAEPVDILVFSSCRALAAAYNRDPALLRAKVKRVHLSAGSSGGYLEWNVMLDPQAFVCVMRSELSVALYPCATPQGPFDKDCFNTYWHLGSMDFVRRMDPRLQAYLCFVYERALRHDWLAAVEHAPESARLEPFANISQHVWETPIWLLATDRAVVRDRTGTCRIVKRDEIRTGDVDFTGTLRPCAMKVEDGGLVSFSFENPSGHRWIYHRPDPDTMEHAYQAVLGDWYASFRLPDR